MSTTKRKNKLRTEKEGKKLATTMFKYNKFTSTWTEKDAENFFKTSDSISILRTGQGDENPVEWIKKETGEIEKRALNEK